LASDRRTVTTLTATNAKLASQLEASQVYFKMIKDEILALKAKIKPAWANDQPIQQTKTIIVGCMAIRFTRTTRAPIAKRESTDTKR
jgi:hypothetical protein